MSTKKFKQILSLLLFLALFGCSGLSYTDIKTTATTTSTRVRIPTSINNAPTSTLQPSVIEDSFEPVLDNCADTKQYNTPPPVETANHFLLLQEDAQLSSLFLLNIANGIETQISAVNPYSIFVSPNQTEFGYVQFNEQDGAETVTIQGSDGDVIQHISLSQTSFFWGWLDSNQIMITTKKDADSTEPYALIVVDLLDGGRKELSDQRSYKDFDNANYLHWQYNRVIYDPTLSFAVYPSHNGWGITLYDLSLQKELLVLHTDVTEIASPVWSPDGAFVAIAGTPRQNEEGTTLNRTANELFLLDKLGNVTQLTHFSQQYGNSEVGNVSWSPDGKYIAMWVRIGNDKNERLMLLNLESGQVTDYCVTGMQFDEGYPMQPKPIWSPDSRVVLINNRDSTKGITNIIWIDIQNDIAGMYPANAYLWGWLTVP